MTTTTEWFFKWKRIITDRGEVSRVELAELSNCSLWTIKALQRDFIDFEKYIIYKKGKFKLFQPEIESSLSTLSDEDREKLK